MSEFVTILIPAFNEEDRILQTIKAVKHSKYANEIIVLDDGSQDDTYKVAKTSQVHVHKFSKNQGKGAVLSYGINHLCQNSTIIVFLDGDLLETAKEVDKLIEPIMSKKADVTIAQFPRAKKKGGFGLVKNLARLGVKFYTGENIYTSLSGQRGFRKEVLEKLGCIPSHYGVEVGMTIDILNMGYKIQEVPVNMTHRETGRDLKSFIHRGRQFYQIFSTLLQKRKEVKR